MGDLKNGFPLLVDYTRCGGNHQAQVTPVSITITMVQSADIPPLCKDVSTDGALSDWLP
jgi:hypothetical protein